MWSKNESVWRPKEQHTLKVTTWAASFFHVQRWVIRCDEIPTAHYTSDFMKYSCQLQNVWTANSLKIKQSSSWFFQEIENLDMKQLRVSHGAAPNVSTASAHTLTSNSFLIFMVQKAVSLMELTPENRNQVWQNRSLWKIIHILINVLLYPDVQHVWNMEARTSAHFPHEEKPFTYGDHDCTCTSDWAGQGICIYM